MDLQAPIGAHSRIKVSNTCVLLCDCLPACLPASRFKYYHGDPLGTVKVLYMHAEPQRLNPAGRFDRFNKSNRNSTAFFRVPVPAAISVAGMAIVGGGVGIICIIGVHI